MPKTFDKEKWKQENQAKVEAAQELLAQGLAKLQSSDDWKKMLAAMAQLGAASILRLSFRNALLALQQRPEATHVATFATWQRLGRQVRKGEKAIYILRPVVKATPEEDAQAKGADAESGSQRRLLGFRPLPVFSLSQSDGEPLPSPAPRDIDAAEAFDCSVETLREVALRLPGAPVSSVALRPRAAGDPESARGWYERETQAVVVVTGETSRAMVFRTLVHEVAHALLHPKGTHHETPEREVEAESTAFVVCSALGLDCADVSFPYVAGWAQGDDAAASVARSGQRIFSAANSVLLALAPEMMAAESVVDGP